MGITEFWLCENVPNIQVGSRGAACRHTTRCRLISHYDSYYSLYICAGEEAKLT